MFAGGFTLDLAEAVCADGSLASGGDPRPAHLAGRQIAGRGRGPPGAVRYRLLETVRQYALERLLDAGEAEWCATATATRCSI